MHPGECVYPPEELFPRVSLQPLSDKSDFLFFFSMLDFFFFAASKLNCFATGGILWFTLLNIGVLAGNHLHLTHMTGLHC